MYVNSLSKLLPSNPIIIEAGAHGGGDTLRMSRIWPQATIYAFEPNPKWHEAFQAITAAHPNISFFPVALGDRVGEADFYQNYSRDNGSDSTLAPINPIDKVRLLKVPMITLDVFAKEHLIERVDFMRLDLQGAEGAVLQASPDILEKTKFIQLETNEGYIYEDTVQFEDLKKLLIQKGFTFLHHFKEDPAAIQGDALFGRL